MIRLKSELLTSARLYDMGPDAFGVLVMLMLWSDGQQSDGVIPMRVVESMTPPRKIRAGLAKLRDCGEVTVSGQGADQKVTVVHYSEHARSHADIVATKIDDRERQARKRAREAQAENSPSIPPPVTRDTETASQNVTSPTRPVPTHTHTQPDPTRPEVVSAAAVASLVREELGIEDDGLARQLVKKASGYSHAMEAIRAAVLYVATSENVDKPAGLVHVKVREFLDDPELAAEALERIESAPKDEDDWTAPRPAPVSPEDEWKRDFEANARSGESLEDFKKRRAQERIAQVSKGFGPRPSWRDESRLGGEFTHLQTHLGTDDRKTIATEYGVDLADVKADFHDHGGIEPASALERARRTLGPGLREIAKTRGRAAS